MTIAVDLTELVRQENVAASCIEVDGECLRGVADRNLPVPESISRVFEHYWCVRSLLVQIVMLALCTILFCGTVQAMATARVA